MCSPRLCFALTGLVLLVVIEAERHVRVTLKAVDGDDAPTMECLVLNLNDNGALQEYKAYLNAHNIMINPAFDTRSPNDKLGDFLNLLSLRQECIYRMQAGAKLCLFGMQGAGMLKDSHPYLATCAAAAAGVAASDAICTGVIDFPRERKVKAALHRFLAQIVNRHMVIPMIDHIITGELIRHWM
ncbi:Uncharacterized protein PBTT_00168 [Plasmodiophora brassicae]